MSAAETWLTPDEVGELTGLKPNSWKAQCRRLAEMGYRFTPNGAGRPLVERASVISSKPGGKKAVGPNWEKVNGKAA